MGITPKAVLPPHCMDDDSVLSVQESRLWNSDDHSPSPVVGLGSEIPLFADVSKLGEWDCKAQTSGMDIAPNPYVQPLPGYPPTSLGDVRGTSFPLGGIPFRAHPGTAEGEVKIPPSRRRHPQTLELYQMRPVTAAVILRTITCTPSRGKSSSAPRPQAPQINPVAE